MTILVIDRNGNVYPCDVLRFIGRTTTTGEEWTTTTRVTTTTLETTTEGATTTGEEATTTGEAVTTTPAPNVCHSCDPPIPSELTVYFDAGDYAAEIPETHGKTYVLYHIGDETECKWATESYIQTRRLPYVYTYDCTPDFGTVIDVTISGIPESNPASIVNGTHTCYATESSHRWRKYADEYEIQVYLYDGRWRVEVKVVPPAITTVGGSPPTYWCRIVMRSTSWACDPTYLSWEKVEGECYDYACNGLCLNPPTIQLSAPYVDNPEPRIYLYWNETDSRWYMEVQVEYRVTGQVHVYRTEPAGYPCDPWVTRYTGWSTNYPNSWLELRGLPSWVKSCCFEGGNCRMTRQNTCNGASWGDGDTCEPNPCPHPVCCYVYDCWGVPDCEDYEANCLWMGVDCHLPGCYQEAPDWWVYYEAIDPQVSCTSWWDCE